MDYDRLVDVVFWGTLAAFVSTIAAGLARAFLNRMGKQIIGRDEDVPPLPALDFQTNNGVLDNPVVAEALKYLFDVHKNAQKGNQSLPVYPQITAAHVATLSTPQQITVVDESYLLLLLGQDGTVIFEGGQGVLLDEWHGFHPHTT